MTSPIVYPPTYTMSITESLALPFDPSQLLATGEVPASATSTLKNLLTDDPVTLGSSPSLGGAGTPDDPYLLTQIVDGPTELVRTGKFLLTVSFLASPSANVWSMELTIIAVA